MADANPSFDRVASTTLKNYRKKLADNVSSHIPILALMRSKGAVKVKGGETLVLPLMDGFANAQSYNGSDVIDITKQDGISAAEYNWKQAVCPVIIEGIEKAQNAGKERQIDLMESLMMQAEKSLEDKISQMFFADGTGNSGKDMLGFEAIIAQDPTTGTLGGINAATNSFWRNSVNTSVGSFASNGETEMSTLMRATQRGTDMVDTICMDTTNFGRLQSLANGRAQYNNPRLAELGFTAMKFEDADVIFDQNSPSDRVYGINTDWLKFYISSDANFSTGKFIEPANQDILVAKIKVYGQLATNRREALWVASGFSA